ncbi:MAG: metallophosphoesterase [Methanosarcinales archaeon]|nr:MAG: metallophosphoesterase [Methanosarcinales archaeon]
MIGIMSDSHDNLHALKAAIQFFNDKKVELVLHAGDLVSPFMIDALSRLNCTFKMCFGNNDGDKININRLVYRIGGSVGNFIETVCDNRKIGMLHGTNKAVVEALVKSGNFDIMISGHTHIPVINHGSTLYINPGEVSGMLTGNKTVALLELDKLQAEIIVL